VKEQWKPIKNYESLYEISNFGRIKNSTTKKILRAGINPDNYLTVSLYKHRERKTYSIFNLISDHFGKEQLSKIRGEF